MCVCMPIYKCKKTKDGMFVKMYVCMLVIYLPGAG